jgi:4-hydroxybutyrate CoA-transferase
MKIVNQVEDIVNRTLLPAGSRIYASGNAATPQVMFRQLAADRTICDVTLMGVLFLGDVAELFTEAACRRITHRIIFNSHHTRSPPTGDGPSISSCTWATSPCRSANTLSPM